MNYYFISVGTYPELQNETENNITSTRASFPNSIMLAPTASHEIEDMIRTLKNKVAPGEDEIQVLPIKHVAPAISSVVSHNTNMLELGIFPNKLTIGKVTPIYKGGNSSYMLQNYRPISMLSIFSKIFQGIIKTRMEAFISKHNIINKAQYGFQKHKSTEDALLEILTKPFHTWLIFRFFKKGIRYDTT